MLKPDIEPEAGRWFYVSDTHVTEVTMGRVLRARAYMLLIICIAFLLVLQLTRSW